jgi:hypothetical protein
MQVTIKGGYYPRYIMPRRAPDTRNAHSVRQSARKVSQVIRHHLSTEPFVASRGAAKVGYRTVDIFAVKSSYNLVKKTCIVVTLLVAKSLISDFRCTTRDCLSITPPCAFCPRAIAPKHILKLCNQEALLCGHKYLHIRRSTLYITSHFNY